MKQINCDKCKKDIMYSKRTVRCNEGYLYLRGQLPTEIAISEIELCIDCKDELGKIIKQWLKD